jgi:hypothetical protein
VQAAVDAASAGHNIRIAGGDYSDPAGTVAVITKELQVSGGYGQSCADDAFDPDLHQTVLDGQWSGSVISITNAGNVLLLHLTLTHGDGSGSCGASHGCGGGIFAKDTNLYVGHCLITENVSSRTNDWGDGGGIYAANGDIEIWKSRIISNTASVTDSFYFATGGGVSLLSGKSVLRENEILENFAGNMPGFYGYGGGISVYSMWPAYVLSNTIQGNVVTYNKNGGGGGFYAGSSIVYLSGNRIEGNRIISETATGYGGGVYLEYNNTMTLTNNLIANNSAGAGSGGGIFIYDWSPSNPVLMANNTIADNGNSAVYIWDHDNISVTNNLIAGHAEGVFTLYPLSTMDTNLLWNASDPFTGTNAILEDPLLRHDYFLNPDSPAVDAGLTLPWLPVDLDGRPRPQGPKYDIGAFEGIKVDLFLPLVMR